MKMKTPERIKMERLAHLNWCLEKLKFYDTGTYAENFEELCRYIYGLIVIMDELGTEEANRFYHQQIKDGYLKSELRHYNIELDI